jgi:protocatechuate 3,4-dioxygenase beta subunit
MSDRRIRSFLQMNDLCVAFAILLSVAAFISPGESGGADPARPSRIFLAPTNEPGERLVVRGTVFSEDGTTPLPEARVHIYHTDAQGLYNAGGDEQKARLQSTLKTGQDGRFEIHTIMPAPYPGGGTPAHIHWRVSAPDHLERVFETLFEGDPHINKSIRDKATKPDSPFSIRPRTRGTNGVWQCTQDISLKRRTNSRVP